MVRKLACALVVLGAVLAWATTTPAETEAWRPSPKGVDFDGNSRIVLSAYSGYPKTSWSLLFSARVPQAVGATKGTFLSVFSKKSESLRLVLANPSNLEVAYGKGARKVVKSGLNIADGMWHTIGLTYSADTATLTANVGEGQADVFFEGMSVLVFGQKQLCEAGCFDSLGGLKARLKDVSLWDIDLGPQEVMRTMAWNTTLTSAQLDMPQLVMYYKLAGEESNVAEDSSANRLHGQMESTLVTRAGDSEAFYFSGQSSISRYFDNTFPPLTVTLALWVQSLSSGASDTTLLAFSSDDDAQEVVLHNPSALKIQITGTEYETTANVNDGQWHHVALVAELAERGGSLRLYVDGAEAFAETDLPDFRLSRTGFVVVGKLPTCTGGCLLDGTGFEGFVQGVRAWSVALSPEQVLSDSGRGTSDFAPDTLTQETDTSLMFVWRADHMVGTRVADVTAAGNDGVAGPQWIGDCPNQCSAPNGQCNNATGQCMCVEGVHGEDCSQGCLHGCSGRGTCVRGECQCFPMFEGADCSESPYLTVESFVECKPLGVKLAGRFCNMLDANGTFPSKRVSEAGFTKYDTQALKAFERVAPGCAHPYARKQLRSVICAHFFPQCTSVGLPRKPCTASCHAFAPTCGFDSDMCGISLFNNNTAECLTPRPIDELSDCPKRCRGNGRCVEGRCRCDPSWAGLDCSVYVGDKGTVLERGQQPFCDMVDYRIPRLINTTWADAAAREAFGLLQPYCNHSALALEKLKNTMCATSYRKFNDVTGEIIRPCRSMCKDYALECGISRADTCFGDFYGEEPECFRILTQAERTLPVYPPCTNSTKCIHGFCRHGACVCDGGWFGAHCNVSLPTCVGYCSHHGVCQGGLCKCLPGWTGDACETVVEGMCDHECLREGKRREACCQTAVDAVEYDWDAVVVRKSAECRANCSGHGSCANGSSLCTCLPGWYGQDCGLGNGTAFGCPNNCSAHGECTTVTDADGESRTHCACEQGWVGRGCRDQAACPSGCHGRGACRKGACKCDVGFMGAACEYKAPKCPTEMVCQNGGKCFPDGQCACPAGFGGLDCRKRLHCGVDYECQHDGYCDGNGLCHCTALWRGFDCTQEVKVNKLVQDDLPELERLARGQHAQ